MPMSATSVRIGHLEIYTCLDGDASPLSFTRKTDFQKAYICILRMASPYHIEIPIGYRPPGSF